MATNSSPLLNAADGKQLASLPSAYGGRIAFSPSGDRDGTAGGGDLWTVDLTGKNIRKAKAPFPSRPASPGAPTAGVCTTTLICPRCDSSTPTAISNRRSHFPGGSKG